MQNRKQIGIIVTAVTAFLCGCPGLFLMFFGLIFSSAEKLEQYGWETSGDPVTVGIIFICFGVLMVFIPLAAGIFTFIQARKAKSAPPVL